MKESVRRRNELLEEILETLIKIKEQQKQYWEAWRKAKERK